MTPITTIIGTESDKSILGTSGMDILFGYGGDDTFERNGVGVNYFGASSAWHGMAGRLPVVRSAAATPRSVF